MNQSDNYLDARLAVAARQLSLTRQEPKWSLGINANQELLLCIDRADLSSPP